MNLGSPDSTSVPDVRRYLNEFLMDEKVIDVPYLLRLFLVRGIISPFVRPNQQRLIGQFGQMKALLWLF